MSYIGIPPASFTNNLTNVQLIDDISSSFNGSTQTFALTSNSAPFHAVSARSLIVILGGIVQKPQVDYTVDGSNITFTTSPVSGLTFAARNIYGLNYLNNVNDGVITPAKLSTGAPTWNTGGTVTVSGDLNVTGSFNSGAQGLFWGDNEYANFGNDNDLRIYHDGNDSYISESGTGNLHINTNGSSIRIISDGSTTNGKIADFNRDGSVNLYYDNSLKLQTTTNGVTINGSGTFDGGVSGQGALVSRDGASGGALYTSAVGDTVLGSSSEVIRFVNNTGEVARIVSSGNVGIGTTNPLQKIHVDSGSNNVCFLGESSSGSNTAYMYLKNATSTGTYQVAFGSTGDDAIIVAGGSVGVKLTAGSNFEPNTDATQNLGSSTKRWANIYSADLQLSNEGSSNDVDGTWGQYTIQEGENDLFLLNRRNGKKYKFVLQEVN